MSSKASMNLRTRSRSDSMTGLWRNLQSAPLSYRHSLRLTGASNQVPINALTGEVKSQYVKCPVSRASSSGRCNTIWYKAVFKGGVYDPRETVWTFVGAEERL